ncbi:hypothetical protein PYCC9005_003290 [Savitreella phatthalungensis]
MEREQQLLEQIAQVAGAINKHNNRSAVAKASSQHRVWTPGQTHNRPQQASFNRSLVLGQKRKAGAPTEWVSSRNRGHLTLTNVAVYDDKTARKLARLDEARSAARRERLRQREERERRELKQLAQTTLVHDGVTYRFNKRFNLLIRVNTDGPPTPIETTIHGVVFLKSPKSENLFRKTAVKLLSQHRANKNKHLAGQCRNFCRTGVCRKNDKGQCCFSHDRATRAVCRYWLRHECRHTKAADCRLIHEQANLHNKPDCTRHIHEDADDDCRFGHRTIASPGLACKIFARTGWCPVGGACPRGHNRECTRRPCDDPKCRLDHPDRQRVDDFSDSTDTFSEEDFDEAAFDADFVHL